MKMYSEDAFFLHIHNSLLQAQLEDIGTKLHWNHCYMFQVNVTCFAFSSWQIWKTRIGTTNTVKNYENKNEACIEKQSVTNYEMKGA